MRSTAWDRTRLNDFPRYLSLDQAVTREWTSSRKSLCLAFHFCCFYCFQAINLYVFFYLVYTQQIILMCCSRARPDSFSHTDGERVAFARRVYVDLIIFILFYFYCAFNAFTNLRKCALPSFSIVSLLERNLSRVPCESTSRDCPRREYFYICRFRFIFDKKRRKMPGVNSCIRWKTKVHKLSSSDMWLFRLALLSIIDDTATLVTAHS